MKKKNLIGLSTAMAVAMSVAPVATFAATTLVDSIGSVNMEDDGTTVGVDSVQTQKTEYYDEITADSDTNACQVYATQASTFSVIIPKTIILDGAKDAADGNIGKYVVTAKGNIGGIETIHVTPDASFKMSQAGKEDIDATVTQPLVNFVVTERTADSLADGMTADNTAYGVDATDGAVADGTVEVTNLSAGSWSGQFNFNINITTDTPATGGEEAPEEGGEEVTP